MRSADLPRFMTAIATMGANWRTEVPQTTADLFFAKFADLDIDAFERLCSRAIDTLEYFPNVAQLRKLATGSDTTRAMEAWGRVLVAIRKCGYLRAPQFRDPVISHVLQQLGGWTAVCRRDSDELHNWTRKEFERLYLALQASPPSEPVQLRGMHDRPRLAAVESAGDVLRALPAMKGRAS